MALSAIGFNMKSSVNVMSKLPAAQRITMRTQDEVVTDSQSVNVSLTLGSTGPGKANQVYVDERTLTAGQAENLNVSGGSAGGAVAVRNPHGQVLSATYIVGWYIQNLSNFSIQIGGDAAYDIASIFGSGSPGVILRPGAVWPLIVSAGDTGYPVQANEVLRVKNLGTGSATYRVYMALIATTA